MDNLHQAKHIVITGVESSGKSTLCEDLSKYFKAKSISETAREFLAEQKGIYDFEDIEKIARFHKQRLDAIEMLDLVIIDTAFIVLKIWSEEKFNSCSQWILDTLATYKPSAYILCDINIPYEADPLRETPNRKRREQLFKNYLAHLQEQNTPFIIVSGTKKERLDQAATFIKSL